MMNNVDNVMEKEGFGKERMEKLRRGLIKDPLSDN